MPTGAAFLCGDTVRINNKSEPVPDGEKIRIMLVWWAEEMTAAQKLQIRTIFVGKHLWNPSFWGELGAVVPLLMGLAASWMLHATEKVPEQVRLWLYLALAMRIFWD